MSNYDREALIDLANRAVVPHEKWRNRDSSDAQKQAGEALALLRAGCAFKVLTEEDGEYCATNSETVWVEVTYMGFNALDRGGAPEKHTYYLPTVARLDRAAGGDWY